MPAFASLLLKSEPCPSRLDLQLPDPISEPSPWPSHLLLFSLGKEQMGSSGFGLGQRVYLLTQGHWGRGLFSSSINLKESTLHWEAEDPSSPPGSNNSLLWQLI